MKALIQLVQLCLKLKKLWYAPIEKQQGFFIFSLKVTK